MNGLYRLTLMAATPLLQGYTVWRALRDGGWRYLRERNGIYRGPHPADPVWVHCASVGEVSAVTPLLARWHAQGRSLLVTTTTPTGAAQLMRNLPGVDHAYLPLDYRGPVQRFLRHYRPRCALIVETEIWPQLYATCAAHGIPLAIINARLSEKTMRAPFWLKNVYRQALSAVSAIFARSRADAARFIALGAHPEHIETLGNLKFAARPASLAVSTVPLSRPYLLAASTREGEERLLAACWRQIRPDPSALLVIAPRHPERRDQIRADLGDWQLALRSHGDAIDAHHEIYLVDTLGELPPFITGARLVFMGGSLVAKGGHNLLEPARLGAAIVVGPHMSNFAAELELLADSGAVRQVANLSELARALSELWHDDSARQRMGEAARSVMDAQSGVLDAYDQRLTAMLSEHDKRPAAQPNNGVPASRSHR